MTIWKATLNNLTNAHLRETKRNKYRKEKVHTTRVFHQIQAAFQLHPPQMNFSISTNKNIVLITDHQLKLDAH